MIVLLLESLVDYFIQDIIYFSWNNLWITLITCKTYSDLQIEPHLTWLVCIVTRPWGKQSFVEVVYWLLFCCTASETVIWQWGFFFCKNILASYVASVVRTRPARCQLQLCPSGSWENGPGAGTPEPLHMQQDTLQAPTQGVVEGREWWVLNCSNSTRILRLSHEKKAILDVLTRPLRLSAALEGISKGWSRAGWSAVPHSRLKSVSDSFQ